MFLLILIPIGISKVPALSALLDRYIPAFAIIRFGLIMVSLFFTASFLYFMLPNTKLKYSDVVPGAVLTVFLWAASGSLLSNYIIYYHQLSVVYGSLGSIIVTLLFFYVINVIFIYGAEFNFLLSQYETQEQVRGD